jgi:hypothetical protein
MGIIVWEKRSASVESVFVEDGVLNASVGVRRDVVTSWRRGTTGQLQSLPQYAEFHLFCILNAHSCDH